MLFEAIGILLFALAVVIATLAHLFDRESRRPPSRVRRLMIGTNLSREARHERLSYFVFAALLLLGVSAGMVTLK